MSFEDIIKRNEKALGRARMDVAPTVIEQAEKRRCPKCRAEAKLLGVERVAAQSSAFRSSRYQCMTCLHAFDVPNIVTLAFLLLGGAAFLVISGLIAAGVMATKDRTALALVTAGFGVGLFLWGILAARVTARSR